MAIVSIVTTTLNRTEYLKQAIQSALSQTFTDFELLICDDGGRVETKELCESLRDERVKHIVNRSPLGIAKNTYSGILNAGTDLIAFLNDDDRWTPDFLESCTRPMLNDPKTVLTFSDHWVIDSSGNRLVTETDQNTYRWGRDSLQAGYVSEPLKLLAKNSIPLAMASVFRKSAVDWSLYSERVGGAYDYFLSYCLLRGGGAVAYVPERLTEYRVHAGSASAKLHLSNVMAAAYVSEAILRDPKTSSIAQDIHSQFVDEQLHLAKLHFRQLNVLSAMAHLAKSVQFRLA
jgi:glycosyltransferase involved in cell wall biosynthesis